ncbi:MAG: hypothetical protein LBI95_02310 [Holosporales bacterium]|nr:hypothetical protein [Holosporales bacterium]
MHITKKYCLRFFKLKNILRIEIELKGHKFSVQNGKQIDDTNWSKMQISYLISNNFF